MLSDTTNANYFLFLVPDMEMVTVADGETQDDRRIILTATVDPPAGNRFGASVGDFPKFPASTPTTDHMATIAFINPAYTLTIAPDEMAEEAHDGQISLDDDTMLTATSTNPLIQISGVGDSNVSGVRISTVTVNNVQNDLNADQRTGASTPTAFSVGTTDRLRVTVSGNFSASDRLFLSSTATGNSVAYDEDSDVTLTISADGTTAEGSAPLSGTGSVTVGSPYSLYYTPGGGPIRRGPLGSSYTLDFAAATARDTMMAAKDLTLEYSGISFTNYAYAIPGPNAADAGNLRIRCEGASDCTVFFRCVNQAGRDVGGFERTTIGAGVTEHFSSMELATMLGVNDWTGRLACSLHSSSRVAVQLLVRSGGTLTNNSFIGGLDASQ